MRVKALKPNCVGRRGEKISNIVISGQSAYLTLSVCGPTALVLAVWRNYFVSCDDNILRSFLQQRY